MTTDLPITRHIPASSFPPVFSCVQTFCAHYSLTLDRHTHWRLTPRIVGHIHGLKRSFGVLQATNGILCHIILEDKKIFTGHIMWFIPADDSVDMEKEVYVVSKMQQEKKQEERRKALEIYD